ncbi:MAG TPA: glycosyltransferase family 39 protein [Ohtaekwangia sp.]|nr:glycosyltransferase family 39 protein [Ohtaekwangia sp.]
MTLANLRTEKSALAIVLILALILGVINIFHQDDAFISFRYAKNLVEYNNFSWNADDIIKIEGYTNFLWTCLLAGGLKLGIDPVISSTILGLCFGIGTLLITYRIGKLLFNDHRYALLSIIFLATNYTFSAYMTGGLETQMQTFLISCSVLMMASASLHETPAKTNFFLVGIFTALAILTRLDSALLCGIFILYFLFIIFKNQNYRINTVIIPALIIIAPILLMVLPWLIWKYGYYGELLPNSFYLKGTTFSLNVIKAGLGYVGSFFATYYFIPFVVILLIHTRQIISEKTLAAFAIAVAIWILYIIKVGGDFMEYRFFVPILPFIMMLLAWSILQINVYWIKMVMIVTVLAGSLSHAFLFTEFWGIQSIKALRNDVSADKTNWRQVGITLGDLFHDNGIHISIATPAAGAIPYYSGLKTIDMLGVNDRWIARNGESIKAYYRPGHNRWAKLDYYLTVKPNLVLGQPQIKEKGWNENDVFSLNDFRNFHIADLDITQLPHDARILEIPLDDQYNLYVLYLIPDTEIDKLIKEKQLKTYPLLGPSDRI